MSEASGTTVGFKKADQQITITHTKAAASFLPKSLRMLKDMEEDTWLSGGELQTDNSSSEDDEQGEEFTPFGGKSFQKPELKVKIKQLNRFLGARSKTKGKKKVNTIRKIASFTKTIAMSSTSSHSSSSKTKSVHKQFANEQGIEVVLLF